ncbi:replication initiator protein A [Enterococcus sp.]|uniref:replication initiator protein A n=1 Tax=Enterococcus sp. TaxID=35783 RepID=UPI002648A1C8|nr:replication initiator protein A [Enterococcus sp.]MDN6563036.1 replication initiator protein A [Enterococcus sp.]
MTKFNFYNADSIYGSIFFQFPKAFVYSEKYKHLSDTAKIAYVILKDRLEFSIKNNWVDANQNVYFVFTNKELCEIFSCSEHKVIKVKKELEQHGLLLQKAMGFDPKAKKNMPNRLYLGQLNVDATDVFIRNSRSQSARTTSNNETAKSAARYTIKKTQSNQETAKSAARYTIKKTQSNQETAKSAVRHTIKKTQSNQGTAKSAVNQYLEQDKELRDNKETEKLDFSTNRYSPEIIKKQNQDLVKNARNYLPESTTGGLFLNKEGVELLSLWCQSPKQMHRFLGIILNAKKAVEREHEGTTIVLDDPQCQEMINKTMRRFFNVLRSDNKKINNVENYLFGAMKETLVAYWNKSLITTNGGSLNEF